MPLAIVRLRPGIDVEETPTLNQTSWSSCQLIRFRDGLPEKIGGWVHMASTPVIGTARGMHCWADLMGNPYLAVGSEQRLMVLENGALSDITPLREINNVAVDFSTILGQSIVTIIDGGAPAPAAGDWVNILVPVSVGGIVLQGLYLISNPTSATEYQITAADIATGTISHAGAVPAFSVSGSGQTLVTVTLNNHGLANGGTFSVQVPLTVGGINIAVGDYQVSSVTTDTFQITPGSSSSGADSVSENGGNARFEYLIPSGVPSATALTGYGVGPYGAGGYGLAAGGSLIEPLRQWFLTNFGQDLLGNYTNGPLYLWVPPTLQPAQQIGGTSPNAISAPNAPTIVNSSFLSMPAEIVVALGTDVLGNGSQDPNLITWSDAGNFAEWTPLSSNQAGSFRLPTGSRIVGGVQGPQFALIWTDIDLYAMQYLGAPLIFGFQKIANATDLLSARSVGIFESTAYWASNANFLMYDGNSVQIVPCPVWDKFFLNLNRAQADKIFCAVNSWFAEIMWFYPSASGNGEVDSYVKFNARERVWDYGALTRTCWEDDNVFGAPIGVDQNGLLQQHETGYDNDGVAMVSFIESGYFSISDGSEFTFIERLIPDFILSGGSQTIQLSVSLQNYPSDTPMVYGPYTVTPQTPYIIVRARNRGAALTIGSSDLGVFWRLGGTRYMAARSGRRR